MMARLYIKHSYPIKDLEHRRVT